MHITEKLIHPLRAAVLVGLLFFTPEIAPAQVPNTLTHSIPAPNGGGQTGEQLGYSVAISGTRMVVGAPYDNTGASDAGRAYVYDLSSATPLVPVVTLSNPSPASQDHFGVSVAISGLRVVVGALLDNAGATDAGSAYVYDLAGITPSAPILTLNNPLPSVNAQFGGTVAISGTRVVVGANADDTGEFNAGSAYVYDLTSGTPAIPVVTLNNPSPAANDFFGCSVAISGTRVVVGAYRDDTGAGDAGSAYVYDLGGSTPSIPLLTINNPTSMANDQFGYSVAISGVNVVVGAYAADTGATDSGSAFFYDLSSATPTVPVSTLNNPKPENTAIFGITVAISGTRVVVGARYANFGGFADAGLAYVYDMDGGTPTVPAATLSNPTPGHSDHFGNSVAIDGSTVIIGAPDDDTVGTDKGYAYIFEPPDTTTLAPTLTSPTTNSELGNPVHVSFTIPEAALPGSVKLSFGTTVLTLASSHESRGSHAFSFNPANPTASAAVASGTAVPDGTYTVTLSYQDALGNSEMSVVATDVVLDAKTLPPTLIAPAASTLLTNPISVSFSLPEEALPGSVVLVFGSTVLALAPSQESIGAHVFTFDPANPTDSPEITSGAGLADGTYTVTLAYRDAKGNPAAVALSQNITRDTMPPVIGGNFSPLLVAEGALPDYRAQATGDAVSYMQMPAPGTVVDVGTVTVTLDGTDAAGNVGQTSFDVRVVPYAPVRSVLESTGAPVPAAGVAESGIPAGAVWTGFGVPSINALGQVAFRGEWRSGKVKGAGIFLERALVAAKGVEFPVLGDPMLGDYGNVSFVGETAVFLKPSLGPLRAVARFGDVPVGGGGAVLKRIGSVAMSESGGDFFFTATLGQAPGAQPKVTARNDAALCGVVEGGAPKVLLREGPDTKSFLALTGRPGSAGNGRGVVNQDTLVLATSTRGENAIMRFLTYFEEPVFSYSLTSDAPGFPAGTKFTKFGLPTQDGDTAIAFRAEVQGGITAIFGEDNAFELERLVATTNPAPAQPAGTIFAELRDPVASAGQVVAFTAKLSGGGTKAADNESVWFRNSAGVLTLVAREGAPAPEVGAKWGAFKSIALPEGALGPIILASLKSTPTSKVTTANDVGLWATDSFGALRLLLREGDPIGTAKVKSFVVLPTVRGSAAQKRSFSNGRVIVKATDTAGAQHLVQIVVP